MNQILSTVRYICKYIHGQNEIVFDPPTTRGCVMFVTCDKSRTRHNIMLDSRWLIECGMNCMIEEQLLLHKLHKTSPTFKDSVCVLERNILIC